MSSPIKAPHVFMIDNYDSFTFNLVQYFGELGAKVTVRRNDEITLADIESALVAIQVEGERYPPSLQKNVGR